MNDLNSRLLSMLQAVYQLSIRNGNQKEDFREFSLILNNVDHEITLSLKQIIQIFPK